MSCYFNQAQSCADCMASNGGACTAVSSACAREYSRCCCDRTADQVAAQAAADQQLEQLRQQIADMNAELMRQAAEESSKRRVQRAQDAFDLQMYHEGMTEVIDVEPIDPRSERRG